MKPVLLFFLFFISILYAGAQKLPNIQPQSLRSPANVKIDGSAAEWHNQFQAYNKAVEVFYTLSNDDENLYLTIQATKPRIIEKIIAVGVKLIINTADKKDKSAKENITVTYPVIEVPAGQSMLWYAGSKEKSGTPIPPSSIRIDTARYSVIHKDSLTTIANTLYYSNAKMIKVSGISDIHDEEISVYNDKHIRVAGKFDNSGMFTYEMLIPVKSLGLSVNAPKQFSYCIMLDSRLTNPKYGLTWHYVYPNGAPVDVDQDLDSVTDFWGEYTLAK